MRDRKCQPCRQSCANLKPVHCPSSVARWVLLARKHRRNIETYFSTNGVTVAQRLELDAMMGTLQFIAASDWVAILPFIMMASDLDDGRFDIRPLQDPPFYSEFVLIEPARKVMSPAAAMFADLLKSEAKRAQAIYRMRTTGPGRSKRRT